MSTEMKTINLDDVPEATANGVQWLIASGVETDEEAQALASLFVEEAKKLRIVQ
jgi:hypothetical protein